MPTPAADATALPTPRLSHLVDVTAALAGHAERHDRTADLPHESLALVHEAGLLTLTVRTEHGGPGDGLADTVGVLTALGRGDPSVALISATTLFAHAGSAGWPAGVYTEVLAESARQPTLINALRVEPDLGTPARGGPGADPSGLRSWNALGIAAIYLGVAGAALDWLTGYLQDRVPTNLGAPLASLPRFQSEVGLISAQLLTAATLVETTALAVDRGEAVDPTRPGIAKTVATTAAIEAVQRAVALIGNAGLSRRHPLERHLRDVLCGRIHTPQDDVVLASAGRAQLERTV